VFNCQGTCQIGSLNSHYDGPILYYGSVFFFPGSGMIRWGSDPDRSHRSKFTIQRRSFGQSTRRRNKHQLMDRTMSKTQLAINVEGLVLGSVYGKIASIHWNVLIYPSNHWRMERGLRSLLKFPHNRPSIFKEVMLDGGAIMCVCCTLEKYIVEVEGQSPLVCKISSRDIYKHYIYTHASISCNQYNTSSIFCTAIQ